MIDQGQVLLPLAHRNLIDADGAYAVQTAMRQAPLDHVLHGLERFLPTDVKAARRLQPGEPARPAGQVQHVGLGEGVLAHALGDFLHLHAAGDSLHASHGIEQDHRKSPDRDERKTPLGQQVVARCVLVTDEAVWLGPFAWVHDDFDGLARFIGGGADVHKAR